MQNAVSRALHNRARSASAVGCLLLWAAISASAQDRPVFRATVSLVHVDAEVTAADGRIIGGLTQDDFEVRDEGKVQPIVHFSADQEPLDLILLFDVSGSMHSKVQSVADAAGQGLRELRSGDRVSVMVFNARTQVISPFTEDLDAVEKSIRDDVLGLPFGGGTLIQSAVDDAALRFLHEKRTERRRGVLIITDDIGQRTRREHSVVRDFWEADALLTGLIIRDPRYERTRRIAAVIAPTSILTNKMIFAGMEGIAAKTGGDAIRAGELGTAFQDAMRRIRTRYSLYYALTPGKPGEERSIHVELTHAAAERYPKAHVRARTGYVVPAAGAWGA